MLKFAAMRALIRQVVAGNWVTWSLLIDWFRALITHYWLLLVLHLH